MPENTNIRNLGKMPDDNRIEGIDVARSIALIGMVYINLNVILGTNFEEVYVLSNLGVLNNALQGRFASLFLVIAGLGLGLFKQKYDKNYDIRIIKRAIFFFFVGSINLLYWGPDIIHMYSIYFMMGIVFIRLKKEILMVIMAMNSLVQYILLQNLNYELGFTINYDYFTFTILKNLLFDGYYPVIPWSSFLILGILISKLDLKNMKILWTMFAIGLSILSISIEISTSPENSFNDIFSMYPYPPNLFFIFSSLGSSMVILSLCLMLSKKIKFVSLANIGRLSFTLYQFHLIYGFIIISIYDFNRPYPEVAIGLTILFWIIILIMINIIDSKKLGIFEKILRSLSNN